MNNGVSKIPSDSGKILEDNTLPNIKNSREQFLEYTGERYVPEETGKIELEHFHRYIFASDLVKGKQVLDIACGEGYGSNILAGTASRVVGVDISSETIFHAKQRYKKANLEFKQGSCDAIPLMDSSVDVAVSFETIEHHDQHEAMFKEIKRILRPGGILIISSPDKYIHTEILGYKNIYHIKELYRHEFEKLLSHYFQNIAFYGQKVIYGSTILREDGPTCTNTVDLANGNFVQTQGILRPLYLIAVASDSEIPPLQNSVLEPPDNHIEMLNSKIYERDVQILLLKKDLSSIAKSLSWRISKPLRFLERIFFKKK